MTVYYTCPKCGSGAEEAKEPNRSPSFHSGRTILRLMCQNCDYTGPDQYHNPGSGPRRRTSSTRKPVPPFFGNAKLSKEADQLTQSSYDLQESLNSRQRARRPAVSAAREQPILLNPISGSMSNRVRIPDPAEQIDSVRQTKSQPKKSTDTRSFKERIFSLSLEEQRRLGYNAIASGMSTPFNNNSLTHSTGDSVPLPQLFSWDDLPSTTVQNVTPLRERTFDTKPINHARLTAQNLGRLQKSFSDDKTTLSPEALNFWSKTNAVSPSVPPVGLKRVRSTKLERHPMSETEPLYLPPPSGPYLNPRRNTSVEQAPQRTPALRAGRRPTVRSEQLRAFSTSNPGSAADRMQAIGPSAAIKHVQSSKPSVAYSSVQEPTAVTPESITATALIQTIAPSQELAQLSTSAPGPCTTKNCPITHPEGIYGIQGRSFYPGDTTRLVPPEVVAAKTRIVLLESGEEFRRYLEDVQLVRAFEDLHVSGSSRAEVR